MFLSVRIARDERDALLIPEAALVPEQSRQFVFVVEKGRAVRREIQIGSREPGRVEVVRGLKSGEQVVVEGTQKVRDGGMVREAPASAADSHVNAALCHLCHAASTCLIRFDRRGLALARVLAGARSAHPRATLVNRSKASLSY